MEPAAYSVGDRVQVRDTGPGVIARINAAGRYDVNLDADPRINAAQGHAAQYPAQPAPEASVYDVSAERLQRLA